MMLPAFVHRLPVPTRNQALTATQAAWEAARRDPALVLWRVTTAPLWLGSEIPVPDAPVRRETDWGGLALVTAGPGRTVRDGLAGLLRRYRWAWVLTALLRGVALGLWIALVWMLIALATDVASPTRWWIGGLMVAGVVLGAAFGYVNRPTPLRLARSLDQTFHLNERLTTALDPALADARGPAMQLQHADTANSLAEIRPEFGWTTFIPFREVFVALIAGLLLLAAFFADVPSGNLPDASTAAVPPFASAADRLAVQETPAPAAAQSALPQEPPAQDAKVLEQAQTSNQTRQDLDALGNALSDYALTKPASDSIAQGDYGQAAGDLHNAAGDVNSLSPEARSSLAGDLEQAASRMSDANPDLAQAARNTADSLRKGDGSAGKKMDDLANQVDTAGQKVAPNAQIAAGTNTSTSAPPSQAGASDGQQSGSPQQGAQGGQQGAQAGTDPGSGAAAQPGLANQEIDPQNQRSSQSGQGTSEQQGGGGQAPSEAQAADSASSAGAQPPSDAASGQSAPSGQEGGDSSGQTGQNAPDSANASEGSGAGGQSDAQSQGGNEQKAGGGNETAPQDRPEADTAKQGQAGNPPPGDQNGTNGTSADAPSGRQSLVLEGTSDENIPSGTDVGSSSLGSGSGASAASGNAAPVAVGDAGPDNNRVPVDYRDYVENYFNRDQP